jgi:hypothetical protein
MPALETVGQYLEEARVLLQDTVVPYRYADRELISALNIGLTEARKMRADLFLPLFEIGYYDPGPLAGPVPPATLTQPVTMDPMYRSPLVYYIVGRAQLRDDEPTVDARAGAMLQKFVGQLLTVNG